MSGSPESNGASAPPIYSVRFKIIAAAVLVLAAVAAVAAYRGTDTSNGDTSGGNGAYVERLIPNEDTQLVQQGTVGIDLKPGWDGSLVIDGTAIPDDQLSVTESFNRIEFTPGPDKALRALPIGKVCATANVFQIAATSMQSRPVTWCFEVI